MRVLVTGGGGFIGANLVRRLYADGVDEVVVLDDFSTGSETNLEGLDVVVHRGSILDTGLLATAGKGVSAIVHLAARPSVSRSIEDPLASHVVNATGTLHVLELARAIGAQVTLASSSSVYGRNRQLPKHEDLRPMPVSPYAVSKLAAESYALAYGSVYGLGVTAFRFFNVYGPLQTAGHSYAAVVPEFTRRALQGQPIVVHGDGTQTRDFTFVDTVTEVLSRVTRCRIECSQPINLAFGSRHSLLDLVGLLEAELQTSLDVVHVDPRPGDVRDSQADSTALASLVPGIRPIALPEGLAATVDWMRRHLPGP